MDSNTLNDLSDILFFAVKRNGKAVTAASCVRACGIPSNIVNGYLERGDDFQGVASRYHIEYRTGQLATPPGYPGARKDSRGSFVYFISAVQRGYSL